MALPSSGQLALSQISDEFGGGSRTNVSLRALAATAGLSAPDAFNEFYGLSNNPAAAHFHASVFTGNGGTQSVSMPFTPTYVWQQENQWLNQGETTSSRQYEFINGFGEFGSRNVHKSMSSSNSSFQTNGFTLSSNTGDSYRPANTNGQQNAMAFFNMPNSVVNPYSFNRLPSNCRYYYNTAAGFGMVTWSGPINAGYGEIYIGYGLNERPWAAQTNSYSRAGGMYMTSSLTRRYSDLSSIMDGGSLRSVETFGLYNFLPKLDDQSRFTTYNDCEYTPLYYGTCQRENTELSYMFYFHPVANISSVLYHSSTSTTKTGTTGWRPRFLMLWPDTDYANLRTYFDGMPPNVTMGAWGGNYWYHMDDVQCTITDTGYTIQSPSNYNYFVYAIR